LVKKESLIKAIKIMSPKGKEEMNLKAMNFGYELVETGALLTGESRAAN
jgi:Pyruvate/2-oxoacid:ferredoxin oxidoreductase gamma subunit